jgi:hypothetical protein
MKRILVILAASAVAVGGAGVASAKPGNGNGAVKSGLAAVSGLAPAVCQAAPSSAGKQTPNGFVVLNAPGKPGQAHKLIGEVSLKGARPGAYDVRLVQGAGCGASVGTLTVNEQGNGNLHFEQADKGSGTWHVVLTTPVLDPAVPLGLQQFASAPADVK